MASLFGTDGVRGLANRDLTAELAVDLSVAAAHVLGDVGQFSHTSRPRPLAIVGRDSRASGEFLEHAVVAGLASAGVDVLMIGVVPTPGVAFLTASTGADLGVMLSASHNPMPDNGIKFFSAGGHKLADELEQAIEQRLREPWDRPLGERVGRVHDGRYRVQEYLDHLIAAAPNPLTGVRVVVDCANGAASDVAPNAYRRLGAEVIAIHSTPDGYNINDGCGSTHMEDLQHAVVEHGAQLGIAHDGDADRCLAVAADGRIIDGDQLLVILALAMRDAGQLRHGTVVSTVMANLGFSLAMADAGIEVIATAVGDRYVLEEMRANGYNLGGEQSGHVVLTDHATTGDGVLTALLVMARMASTGAGLAELADVMTPLPQVLINVPEVDKHAVDSSAAVAAAVAAETDNLAGRGRVLLRKSGTEPLVRVMVEAPSIEQANACAERLVRVVRQELSLR
ncbi:MAG: phosphoglucosamine mutase [Actinomycetota bacterium]|nr:phosphoglucosamine mutase [Actinomycetota bacterium]